MRTQVLYTRASTSLISHVHACVSAIEMKNVLCRVHGACMFSQVKIKVYCMYVCMNARTYACTYVRRNNNITVLLVFFILVLLLVMCVWRHEIIRYQVCIYTLINFYLDNILLKCANEASLTEHRPPISRKISLDSMSPTQLNQNPYKLELGSTVEFGKSAEYGVIKWIGRLPGIEGILYAGVEAVSYSISIVLCTCALCHGVYILVLAT